jgi:uncharacterized peroxidase-related enzyme
VAHIKVTPGVPGIISLLSTYTDTAESLNLFTQQILRGKSSLTEAERELIAAFVSSKNDCKFCLRAHSTIAKKLFPPDQAELVDKVIQQSDLKSLSEKMQALLEIAAAVQKGGKYVTKDQIKRARSAGADDRAIHDTVLVAASFCMFNRYVDGLGTWTPEEQGIYENIGTGLAARGYTG